MNTSPFEVPLSSLIWANRYRWNGSGGEGDVDIQDTWRRVARTLASVEYKSQALWAERFFDLLRDFRFLPGGRILAGAGTDLPVTLFNCFVGDAPDGSYDHLVSCLDELGRVSMAGGGLGTDFSNAPPHLAAMAARSELTAGPVPLVSLWDAMCNATNAMSTRQGALMAALRCDHPDVQAFIAAKHRAGELAHLTLSLLVSDQFMEAVAADREWPLIYPSDDEVSDGDAQTRSWPSFHGAPRMCRTWQRLRAQALWQAIVHRNQARSEPGLLFVDTIQRLNPLNYAEEISCTNPCGEVPLPRYGACDLGSFNLTRFVVAPLSAEARFDEGALLRCVPDAVRMLDNVYELSAFPTPRHADTARASRRIGLGITGLADTLILLGMHYDSVQARAFVARLMRAICAAAYSASTALAVEKGAFPQFSAKEHTCGEFVSALGKPLREAIARNGLRNSHLLAIAPAGSISLLANCVSSGIEPLVGYEVQHTIRLRPGHTESIAVQSYAMRLHHLKSGEGRGLPEGFVTSAQVTPEAQIAMQAVVQRHVDNAIAKTVTVPHDFSAEQYSALLRSAHAQGLKGLCTHRPGSQLGCVVTPAVATADAARQIPRTPC